MPDIQTDNYAPLMKCKRRKRMAQNFPDMDEILAAFSIFWLDVEIG
jgi:hypothetical protein